MLAGLEDDEGQPGQDGRGEDHGHAPGKQAGESLLPLVFFGVGHDQGSAGGEGAGVHRGLRRAEHPDAARAVLGLSARENVWVKVSGHYRSPTGQAEAILAALLERGAGHRLVFGSDWPHTRHEQHTCANILDWTRAQVGPDLLHGMLTTAPGELFGWCTSTLATPTV